MTKPSKNLLSLVFSALALAICAESAVAEPAGAPRVKIHAGDHDRVGTPVSIDMAIGESDVSIVQIDGALGGVGQIESLGRGKSRIHWLIEKLAAGETASPLIRFERGRKVPTSFAWTKPARSEDGLSSDLAFGDRPVLRYMHTPFDKNDIELTKKVFHHLWTPDGSRRMTKGPGGLYPHHRGIYFGYSKIRVGDAKGTIDTWHGKNGEHQAHDKVHASITGPVLGGHVVRVLWVDRAGKPFIEETRRITVYLQPGASHLVDFQSKLEAIHSPVRLDGDPQHSGVQFRANQYVAEHQKATTYLRPAKWKELPEDKQINWPQNKEHREMPWNAVRFGLPDADGEVARYTVAYLSHPSNPGEGRTSERLYGRFGEYFEYDLSKEKPLEVHYRWWVTSSDKTTREAVQARYDDLADPPKVELFRFEAR